jgi:acyl-coenzyme A thioesterase PaaI-like protein
MHDSAAQRALQEFVQSPDNVCFACGPGNPCGLHLQPRREGDLIVAEFVPGAWHEGWRGVVHGGILTTILDETMAYALFLDGYEGLTARMDLRYRASARHGDRLRVEARLVSRRKRVLDMSGVILRAGEVILEGNARFMIIGRLDIEAWQTSDGVG